MKNGKIVRPNFLRARSEEEELYNRYAEMLDKASKPQVVICALLSTWNYLCARCGVKDPWGLLIKTAQDMKAKEQARDESAIIKVD